MRGIVFSLPRRVKKQRVYNKRSVTQMSVAVKRYGTAIFFTFVYACGLLMGSLYAKNAPASLLEDLNFLFTTNLSARMEQPVFATFATSFASNFLFLVVVFLCGLAPWGMVAAFLSPAFKGFGVGISAGYLFVTYGFRGVGFYLLVILTGTFIFSFALILECIQAHYLSCKLARFVFTSAENVQPVSVYVRSFLLRSLYMLILTAVAALADMLLWTAFSGLFF